MVQVEKILRERERERERELVFYLFVKVKMHVGNWHMSCVLTTDTRVKCIRGVEHYCTSAHSVCTNLECTCFMIKMLAGFHRPDAVVPTPRS